MVNLGAIGSTVGKGLGNIFDGIGTAKALNEQKSGISTNQDYLQSQTDQMGADYDSAMSPYIQGGQQAYSNLQNMQTQQDSYDPMKSQSEYGFEMQDFEASPSYDWRMSQGVAGLDQGAASDGSLYSGGQQKALLDYGQNLASEEYSNEYDRQFNEYQDANTQFQNSRDYNTALDSSNYDRELGVNQYLNNQGYDANASNANTQLGLQEGLTQGMLNYNTDMANANAAKQSNLYGTMGDQNRIAGQGMKDYFSFGG